MIELVRHHEGAPTASDFASGVGPPIIMDTTTGDLYTIDENGVVQLIAADGYGYPAALGHAGI